MSAGTHPRIAARRRGVAEQATRRRLRWVVAVMTGLLLGGLGYWLVQSPLLAVDRIEVRGDLAPADVVALSAAAGVEVGDPILFVRPNRLRDAIAADPRVADVRVTVRYPHAVAVDVLAHRPLAWVRAGPARWLHVTADGHVVAATDAPGPGARVEPAVDAAPGDRLADPGALAAVAFAAALPDELEDGSVVTVADGGRLTAVVGGHAVTLGAPARMADKAAVVGALLDGAPPGATVDVSAPDRPAMHAPAEQPEASVEPEG